MIRIGDHLINLHIIRHIWIETSGGSYVVFIDIDDGYNSWITIPAMNRAMAESILDTIQKEIEDMYALDDDDGEEDYV